MKKVNLKGSVLKIRVSLVSEVCVKKEEKTKPQLESCLCLSPVVSIVKNCSDSFS